MSWQSIALFAILVTANLLGPTLKVDPQVLGTLTTIAAALFVQRKNKKKADTQEEGGQ